MTIFVALKDLESQIGDVTAKMHSGESVVVTINGQPMFDLAPHQRVQTRNGGLDYARGRAALDALGVDDPFPYVADDFDAPLSEDFLLRPLPR